jgi:hypothetical protein
MLGLAWLARRFRLDEKLQGQQKRRAGELFVEESLYIDAKRRLIVVGHGSQRFLVLLSASGDVNLGALMPAEGKSDGTL